MRLVKKYLAFNSKIFTFIKKNSPKKIKPLNYSNLSKNRKISLIMQQAIGSSLLNSLF